MLSNSQASTIKMLSSSQQKILTILKSSTLEDLYRFHETVEGSCKLHKMSAQMPTVLQDARLICLGSATYMFFRNVTTIFRY